MEVTVSRTLNLPVSLALENRHTETESQFSYTSLTLEGNEYQNFHNSNKLLALWLNQANASNLSISGNILLRKAADFAWLLNIDGFGGTQGWLSRFKKRYNIRYITKCGEANSAPLNDLPQYRKDSIQLGIQ